MIGALLHVSGSLMAPTFTYKTMVIPEVGPPDNAIQYGAGLNQNRMAEFFTPDMPADRLMGLFPEAVRRRSEAKRSMHPILSFAGIGVDGLLQAQSLAEPFGPLRALIEQDGFVLLVGVDQRVNTSIHYGEAVAGRKQFVRWAMTPEGVRECPGFPGCSEGFNQAAPLFESFTGRSRLGGSNIQAIPARLLVEQVTGLLGRDPLALLCGREDCQRCSAVRAALRPQEPGAE